MEFVQTVLRPHIIQIENPIGNCYTLVLGREKALLFDTMAGLGDLKKYVEGLTSLPLTVLNSHGHFDHMGGSSSFDEVYMNRLDWPLLPRFEECLEVIGKNAGCNLSRTRGSYRKPFLPLEPGMTWELGGITARAVSLPGHTPGSMGLLLEEDKILLAGDALSPEMCLFFPESLPLRTYLHTLNQVEEMPIDWFIQGHYNRLFPKSLLKKLHDCALLPGQKKGYPYVNSLIPSLRGTMFILEFQNPDADGTICIITKEGYDVSA